MFIVMLSLPVGVLNLLFGMLSLSFGVSISKLSLPVGGRGEWPIGMLCLQLVVCR
jgi:hypothetical protein